jgi:hypothetical protein
MEIVKVECNSEYSYAQRPSAIWWQGRRQEVETVESEWRTPRGKAFRVRTRLGSRFELLYAELEDSWQAEII